MTQGHKGSGNRSVKEIDVCVCRESVSLNKVIINANLAILATL